MTTAALLEVEEVTVRFGGLVANDGVWIEVPHGAIAAVIGPNGAGKTTLFNTVSGAIRPTRGRVAFAGRDVTRASRARRARLGIARTFQQLALVPELTAVQNVAVGLGRFRRTGLAGAITRVGRTRRDDWAIGAVARRALQFVGLGDVGERPASDLSYGDRRRVELARALALAPRLLLLDEPTAGMGPGETAALAATIARARDELGVTVLVVEHDMAFVRNVADVTTVLELGTVIASGPTQTVLTQPRVIEAYLGAV